MYFIFCGNCLSFFEYFSAETAFLSLNIQTGKKQPDVRTIDQIFKYSIIQHSRTVQVPSNSFLDWKQI